MKKKSPSYKNHASFVERFIQRRKNLSVRKRRRRLRVKEEINLQKKKQVNYNYVADFQGGVSNLRGRG